MCAHSEFKANNTFKKSGVRGNKKLVKLFNAEKTPGD